MLLKNKRLTAIVLSVAVLLMLRLVTIQFSSEVNWSPFDFVVAGVLLLGTGMLCELVIRNVRRFNQRIAVFALLLVVLFLVWAELAVGIFGSPFAGS